MITCVWSWMNRGGPPGRGLDCPYDLQHLVPMTLPSRPVFRGSKPTHGKDALIRFHLLALCLAVSAITARADTHTWTGGGGDNNWNTTANWGGTAPVSGDSLVFAGTSRLTPNNNFSAGTTFSNVTFDSSAGAFTNSGNSFALAGEIVNHSTNLQTLNLGFSCSPTGTVNTASGDITINGVISGAGTLRKRGDGKLTLTGNNTYNVGTTIAGGTLSVSRDNLSIHQLGTLSADCTLTFAGGALEVTGDGLYGPGTNWLLRNIVLADGGGTITSPLQIGHENYSGIGEYITGGTASNGLTLKGWDITLRPGAQNTLGKLTVDSGRTFLRNEDSGKSYPVAGTDLIVVNGGATLLFTDHMPRSITNSMTFAPGAALCTRTHANYSGAMTLSTTNAHFPAAGTMIFNADDQVTDTIMLNGAWPELTGDLTIQVGGVNASVGTVTLNGALSGNHALLKTASGTLVLSAANTHNGGTTVSGGTLEVRKDGGLGLGSVSVAGVATLKLNSGATNNYLNDTASLLLNNSATVNLAYTGTDILAALSFDGGATFQALGTWGSTTTSATHKDSHFIGSGILSVVLPTATTVGSSTNPSRYGQPAIFTATVTAAGGTPTGTVQFMTNGANFGSPVALSGGSATSSALPATLPPGAYPVTASYSPSGTFGASTGTLAGGQAVNPLPASLTGSRFYDGTTAAAAVILNVANKVGGDDVMVASGSGTLAGAVAGSQAMVSFGTLTLGGATAGNYTLTGATGMVTILAGPAAQTCVETATDGSGTIVGTQNIRTGDSITVHAIIRDAGGNFVTNAAASWSLTNTAGGLVAGDLAPQAEGKSAIFTGHATGIGRIQAVAGGFAGQSGLLAVPAEAGTIQLPVFEDSTISVSQPPCPDQTSWVNGTNNNQYARWSIAAGEGVGGSDAAVARPGPNAMGGSANYIQALRIYYFPVWSNTQYTVSFFCKAAGPGFNGAGNSGASEMQLQVLESPNLEGGGWLSTDGMNVRTATAGWSNVWYTFTAKPATRCVCLKFSMLFGDGNRIDPADSFYLDDDRGTTNTLSSSGNPSAFGQPVIFTATVGAVNPALGTPAGTVQFKTNGINFGSATGLSGSSATSDVLPAALPPGVYTVTADYSGDSRFTRSTGTLANGQAIYVLPEPRIGPGPAGENKFIMEWPGTAAWLYTVQGTPSLDPVVWSNLPAFTGMTGWNGTMSMTNNTDAGEQMFYRIQMTR
jgi:autotransporter-associated beta strand protein